MSHCGDKYVNFGRLCISSDDFTMIFINIISITIIMSFIYIKSFLDKSHKLSALVKNNFTILGEGSLNSFYSTSLIQQKTAGPKKKIGSKGSSQINQTEITLNNNELKCNQCGRSVEVSYQYTMHKIMN